MVPGSAFLALPSWPSRRGRKQPMLPGWNPKGYLNNATHRITVAGADALPQDMLLLRCFF